MTTKTETKTITPDMGALKTKLKGVWMDGDYVSFARYLEPGALQVLEGWAIAPGEELLDVGCGAGQIAIPAARNGVDVTAVDIAANLIEHARGRARIENLDARFEEADAEDLPFPSASFDVVTSLIGAMFAPQPDKVAAEFARVCRSGGRLHMANWTPQGFVGQFFKALVQHVPPPAGVPSAFLWGDEAAVTERLEAHFTDITLTRKRYQSWHYPFASAQVVELFRSYYGPIKRAFDSLDDAGQAALRADLEKVFEAHNKATDGTTTLDGEYLDIYAIRK